MYIVRLLSYKCARAVQEKLGESHAKRYVYHYALLGIIGSIVEFILLFAVSFALGTFKLTLIATATFIIIRLIAGGYHMDTYSSCMYISLVMFIAAGLLAKHISITSTTAIISAGLAFIYGFYAVARYAPRNNQNAAVKTDKQKSKFKAASIILMEALAVFTILLIRSGSQQVSLALILGMLIETFSITNLGFKFFDYIKQSF